MPIGGRGRTRTYGLSINSRLFCQLNYLPTKIPWQLNHTQQWCRLINILASICSLHQPIYSATREISLSFGERPLTSYPRHPYEGVLNLCRTAYLQVSPIIQKIIFYLSFLSLSYFYSTLVLYRILFRSKQTAWFGVPSLTTVTS